MYCCFNYKLSNVNLYTQYSPYHITLERYTALEAEKTKRVRKSKELKAFTKTLKQQPLVVAEWNERLWITLLDTATVNRDGKIVFRFKSGVERIG